MIVTQLFRQIQFTAANIHSLLFPGHRSGADGLCTRNRANGRFDTRRGRPAVHNGRNLLEASGFKVR
jgi:hypothetical protein